MDSEPDCPIVPLRTSHIHEVYYYYTYGCKDKFADIALTKEERITAQRATWKRWKESPTGIAWCKAYKESPERIAAQNASPKRYDKSPKGIAAQKRYDKSPKGMIARERYEKGSSKWNWVEIAL